MTRIPGDLSEAAIERICQDHRRAIRLYGFERATRLTYVTGGCTHVRGAAGKVLRALEQQCMGIDELARALSRTPAQIHGLIGWLRKVNRIEVRYWTTSRAGRRVAIYGVIQ